MVFLAGMEKLLVVWSLEKVYDEEEEELAMISVVKEEEGASELVEAWHMEQELVLAVKSPLWEEVEICTCMEEKLAPP